MRTNLTMNGETQRYSWEHRRRRVLLTTTQLKANINDKHGGCGGVVGEGGGGKVHVTLYCSFCSTKVIVAA